MGDGAQMALQIVLGREGELAEVARVRLELVVHAPHVRRHVLALAKALRAAGARKRLVALVHRRYVLLQVLCKEEARLAAARHAGVRPLLLVYAALVLLQVGVAQKRRVAPPARDDLLAGVLLHAVRGAEVVQEPQLLRESGAAQRARVRAGAADGERDGARAERELA
eukprot:IDg12363t1